MAKGSDNPYPSVLLVEQGSAPTSPASGQQRLYLKSSDHLPYVVNSSGTVTAVGGGGGGGGGGLYSAYLCYQEQQTSNTNGGTFTSGSWVTRVLNTEVADTGSHGSVASNQITLAAGTYHIYASAPAFIVNHHIARLQDITNSATLVVGTAEIAPTGVSVQTRSIIAGRFTISGTTVLEIQHQCSSTQGSNGLGDAAGFTSTIEVYTIVELWKE